MTSAFDSQGHPARQKPAQRRSAGLQGLGERLAIALILAQGVSVARMPFAADRFFCWSPHDSRGDFEIRASWRGEAVSNEAIHSRYRLPGMEWHAMENVKLVVRTAEERIDPAMRWDVRLVYRVNLGPEQVWEFGTGPR